MDSWEPCGARQDKVLWVWDASKPYRIFVSLFETKLITIARKQDLKRFGGLFCSFFYAFEIRKECKEGGRKQGGEWITGELTRLCALLRVVRIISKVCSFICTRTMGRACIRQR